MALIMCSECGSDISDKASVCPKCGCPVDVSKEIIIKHKRKIIKKIAIGIMALIVVAIIVAIIIKIVSRPKTDGYYGDTKWGMTAEQVKNLLGDEATISEEDTVLISYEDYEGKNGIDALIMYDCTDNSLKEISIILTNGDDSSYTDSKLINECTEELSELYGEAQEDLITTSWNTPRSKIELTHIIDGMVIITYKDITKVEE